ncbi:hypothetical protein [Hymenobacter psychrotolerans]|uniref:Uncharacterized protein n=1 Tax=Hymenobacter psychrotolerans DSM 18569 TaxID=1121959 RepID=A0A1M7ADF1_9BACT|nr:hypothetical protein [Hymenobacter psychrotolerans]SHL40734.1 hypothetical protein SAMN02746009_02689 [Hymenobacter psychrotolerans DSM 18569]
MALNPASPAGFNIYRNTDYQIEASKFLWFFSYLTTLPATCRTSSACHHFPLLSAKMWYSNWNRQLMLFYHSHPITMNSFLKKISAVALFSALSLGGTNAWAQNTYGGVPQRGNGAFVLKEESTQCLPNSLLGVPALAATDCVTMTREKLVATPSGKATIVWRGTVPVAARPAQRVVFNSTFTENTHTESLGRVYDTVAITDPNGSITLTLTDRDKTKGRGKK